MHVSDSVVASSRDEGTIPSPGRPVVLIRPLTGGIPFRKWVTSGTKSPRLVEALAVMGIAPGDVACIEHATMVPGPLGRLPRDLAWKTLPVVENPDRVVHESFVGDLTSDGAIGQNRHRLVVPTSCAATLTHVVIDTPEPTDEIVDLSLSPLLGPIMEGGAAVLLFDGTDLTPIPHERIVRLASVVRLRERLLWSFCVNWTIMASRAIAAVAVEKRWTREWFRLRMPRLEPQIVRAFSPLAAQMLYALDRLHHVCSPAGMRGMHPARWNARIVEACPWVRDDGDGLVFEWKGTGTYPPLVCRPRPNTVEHERPSPLDVEGVSVFATLVAMARMELIGIDDQGRMGVTDLGRRVVDLAGHALDDPDLPLRWLGRGDDAIPDVDRWLNRAFRATKRRVADLPATPYIEVPGGEAERSRTRHFALVYGRMVPLGGRMRDPAIRTLVETIVASQADLPFMQRRVGVVESAIVQPAAFPTHLWYGVPVGVEDEDAWNFGWTGWHRGLLDLNDRVDEVRGQVPPLLLSDVEERPLDLSAVGAVDDSPIEGLMGPGMGIADAMTGASVVIGVVAQAWWNTTELVPPSECPVSRFRAAAAPGPEGLTSVVDHVAHFGGPMRVWWGVRIGTISSEGDDEADFVTPTLPDAALVASVVGRELRALEAARPEAFLPPDAHLRLAGWWIQPGRVPRQIGGSAFVDEVIRRLDYVLPDSVR